MTRFRFCTARDPDEPRDRDPRHARFWRGGVGESS